MATNQQNQRGGSSEQHAEAGRKGGEANAQQNQGSSQRGFAGMDEEEQRRIASEGGKAAHASGHAHEWNSEEVQEAGRKGGEASHGGNQGGSGQRGGSSEQRAEAGRKGGEASHGGGNR